jgi:hypothetical protein
MTYWIGDVLRRAELARLRADALEEMTLMSGAMRGEFEVVLRIRFDGGYNLYAFLR